MEAGSATLTGLPTYPWGIRHDGDGSYGESVLPRDNSLADIAPWTTPGPSEVSRNKRFVHALVYSTSSQPSISLGSANRLNHQRVQPNRDDNSALQASPPRLDFAMGAVQSV